MLLERNLLPWSPADIFIFHEADLDESMLSPHAVFKRLDVKFAEVDFSSVPYGTESLTRGQRGYRHMCHFFANDVFLRNELSSYEYYMRLDVDSFILSKISFNIFDAMRSRNLKYAYRMIMTENARVAEGLLETAKAFFSTNRDIAVSHPYIRKAKLYYTNFEICDLKFFRSDPWQRYFAAIDSAGGIWRTRWGDAPIRWLGLQYLLRKNEIWFFRGMTYHHQFLLHKGFGFRFPIEYAKCVISALIRIFKLKIPKRHCGVCATVS